MKLHDIARICTKAEDVIEALAEQKLSREQANSGFFEPELAAGSYEPLWDELDLPGVAEAPSARESFEPSQVDCPPHSPRIGEARPAEQPLADVAARAAELLGPVPVSVDELARLAGSPARRVRSVLIELELAGRIEWHGGGLVSSVSEPEE